MVLRSNYWLNWWNKIKFIILRGKWKLTRIFTVINVKQRTTTETPAVTIVTLEIKLWIGQILDVGKTVWTNNEYRRKKSVPKIRDDLPVIPQFTGGLAKVNWCVIILCLYTILLYCQRNNRFKLITNLLHLLRIM